MAQSVIIYSTPTCPFCNMAKEFFKENNIIFTDYDVAADAEKREEMIKKSGQMAVPVIDIDGKIIVGFNKEEIKKSLGLEQSG